MTGVVHSDVDADGAADFELTGPGNGGDDWNAAADGGEEGEGAEIVEFSCERGVKFLND